MCIGCTPEGEKVVRMNPDEIARRKGEEYRATCKKCTDMKKQSDDKKKICQKVKNEIEEASKIRNAYTDKELLREADEKNWDGYQYHQAVEKKLFGSSSDDGSNKAGVKSVIAPMYTNPETCIIHENWDLEKYRQEGLPDVIYHADRIHEQVHKNACERLGGKASREYVVHMSFPRKRSADEIKAYDAKIEYLKNWVRNNCN